MLDSPHYPIKDSQAAADFLRQSLSDNENVSGHLDKALQEMLATRDPGRFLYVRYGVMTCISAAYATRNRAAFGAAVDRLIAHPLPADTQWYRPGAAQLGTDLAVALSCARYEQAHALGRQILQDTSTDDALPEDLQARVLAMLFDADYERAAETLVSMEKSLGAAKLSRYESATLLAWLRVAECVAARSDIAILHDLAKTSEVRAAYVDKMLARWKKGQSTDLTAIDFWDYQTSALVVIAASFGLIKTPETVELPFADWRWTERVAQWA